MIRAARFVVALVLGLGVLTWGAARWIEGTTRDWFERDVSLRAQLAVSGARPALAANVRAGDHRAATALLEEITRDERILASAVCGFDGGLIARTREYPASFSCASLAARLRGAGTSSGGGAPDYQARFALPTGEVFLSAIPLVDEKAPLGFVVLLHDMSFMQHREQTTQRFIVMAFAVLSAAAALVTLVAARISRRSFTEQLRRWLRDDATSSDLDFQPLLGDVRALVKRLSSETLEDDGPGAWSSSRLRRLLEGQLLGERVIVLANREPYIHERDASGKVGILHPASGLVTALEPVMRACSGVWVAHGSGSADRESADGQGRLRVPPEHPFYDLRRVWLSEAEERGYYYGFANEGLWPLCHIADTRPTFRKDDWNHYVTVNDRFARAVCDEADVDDPIVLIQDYHFALAPKFIRQRLPRATILCFWHIPWPNSERFGICPWRAELIEGLLSSSILGFHTQLHCNNFVEAVDRFLEARIDREQNAVVFRQRTTLVRPYPISIEWPNRWAEEAPPVEECRRSIREELGLSSDALLGVGVDRLDYTKGVEERFAAVERALELDPGLRGRFTFVQLAAPSRTLIERYRLLNDAVERQAARINGRFGGAKPVIVLRRSHHEPPEVFRHYRAADVCYVSSLHDGMNLVAKEFIAARSDEHGVLVLSHFTGAARELTEALIVNPYDIDQSGAALVAALRMPAREQEERMRAMRRLVSEYNVYRWAGRMLSDAARQRQRDRLTGRLGLDAAPSGAEVA